MVTTTKGTPLAFASSDSSTIVSASYDPKTETMTVQFRHGDAVYRYTKIPALTWHGFYHAESRGKFFQQRIRPVFTGEEL